MTFWTVDTKTAKSSKRRIMRLIAVSGRSICCVLMWRMSVTSSTSSTSNHLHVQPPAASLNHDNDKILWVG